MPKQIINTETTRITIRSQGQTFSPFGLMPTVFIRSIWQLILTLICAKQSCACNLCTKDQNERTIMADLHLNLNGEYFDQIKAGVKFFEYRLATKWAKRLEGKAFDRILIKRGYPKKGDQGRIIERPWRGFELQTIAHPHFGQYPVEVYAILVN